MPDAGKPRVFLAECMSEIEDEERRLRAFLAEDLGWVVLPQSPLVDQPFDQYRSLLEADLRQCLAFVQLLGQNPWRGGGFDVRQHDAAVQLNLPMFRFRGDVDLAKPEKTNPAHHQFLTARDVIAGCFEDFKFHLREKLTGLAQDREKAIRQAQEADKAAKDGKDGDAEKEIPPLVRVAIRAGNPRALWSRSSRCWMGRKNAPRRTRSRGDVHRDARG